ncbi:hypothetical protein RHMOL_Rhmol06G0221500 [Rhododendron molle]|uniref:Uncharacterized protein n=1 Tax=Rhododendron molle TaxID=49168 RepID=A0ACC0NGL3_RHOML|nr:hypothetical protein RHMOL_Rhmol06G0221500 [Rhododendron molle]
MAHSQVVSGRCLADKLAGCLKEDIRQFKFLESLNLTLNEQRAMPVRIDSREIFQGQMITKEKVKMNTSDAREKVMTGQRFCYFWTVRLWKYRKKTGNEYCHFSSIGLVLAVFKFRSLNEE